MIFINVIIETMRKFRIRQAEYPVVGSAMKESFSRDQEQFSTHYKSMDETFLSNFGAAIADVRNVHLNTTGMPEQKEASARVYELQDSLYKRALFLKDYVSDAGLDTALIAAAVKALRRTDTEAAVKAVRQAVAYYTPLAAQLTDMPEGFAETFITDAGTLEELNIDQNTAMNFRVNLTDENRAKYDALDDYIRKVGNAGKRIFKGTPKANEYTVSHLLSRIRAPQRLPGEPETGVNE